jgi:hypothetical protein
MRPYIEKTHHTRGLVEWLKVKALSSNPSTAKKFSRKSLFDEGTLIRDAPVTNNNIDDVIYFSRLNFQEILNGINLWWTHSSLVFEFPFLMQEQGKRNYS